MGMDVEWSMDKKLIFNINIKIGRARHGASIDLGHASTREISLAFGILQLVPYFIV